MWQKSLYLTSILVLTCENVSKKFMMKISQTSKLNQHDSRTRKFKQKYLELFFLFLFIFHISKLSKSSKSFSSEESAQSDS